jgi:hypothetical protein
MSRRSAVIAGIGLLITATIASASQAPQRIETRPYEHLVIPIEATTAAVGGPAVILTDKVKSTVVVEFTGGAPCGPLGPDFARADSQGESGGMGIWLPVGIGTAAVAGIALVGYLLLRQSRV